MNWQEHNKHLIVSRVGEKHFNNIGEEFEIIKTIKSDNMTIIFKDGVVKNNVSYRNIKKGAVSKPVDRLGEKRVSNQGCSMKIVEYTSSNLCKILFEETGNTKLTTYQEFKKGTITNPLHKNYLNIGFEGIGKYLFKKHKRIYKVWSSIIARGYNKELKEKYPAYKDVTVCEEWHNFQNFAKWMEENYKTGFHLDKDILVKGNKIYSPETCCFVPQEINSLFKGFKSKKGYNITPQGNYIIRINKNKERICLGRRDTPEEAFEVYKIAKEDYIKEIANKWKDKIDPQVYESMINYKMEIID